MTVKELLLKNNATNEMSHDEVLIVFLKQAGVEIVRKIHNSPRVNISLKEFILHCPTSGRSLISRLLSGIRYYNKEVYDLIPKKQLETPSMANMCVLIIMRLMGIGNGI